MACGTGLRPIFLTEPWPSLPCNSISNFVPSILSLPTTSDTTSLRCFGCRIFKTRNLYEFSRKTHDLKCTHTQNPSSDDEFDPDQDQGPPQEAVLKAISGSYFLPILIIISRYFCMYMCLCYYDSLLYATLDWFLNCALYVVHYVKNMHVSVVCRI